MSLPDFKNLTSHIKKQSKPKFDRLLAQKGPAVTWENIDKRDNIVSLDEFEKGLKNLN